MFHFCFSLFLCTLSFLSVRLFLLLLPCSLSPDEVVYQSAVKNKQPLKRECTAASGQKRMWADLDPVLAK